MVRVFISFKEKGKFNNRIVFFPEEFKRLEDKYSENWISDNSQCDYIIREDVKRLKAGFYVFVYVGLDKGEKFSVEALACILKVIFGRYGVAFETHWNKYYALIPRWGDPIIMDKGGYSYDVKNAINYYVKGKSWEEIWNLINERRRRKKKTPYNYVAWENCRV